MIVAGHAPIGQVQALLKAHPHQIATHRQAERAEPGAARLGQRRGHARQDADAVHQRGHGVPGRVLCVGVVGLDVHEEPGAVVGVFLAFGEHGSDAAFLASRVIERYLRQPTAPIPVTDEGP